MSEDTTPNEWPLRPWLLAGLLGLAGLGIWLVTGGDDTVPWQMAAAAFLFFGAIAAAFTLEDGRWKQPAIFAVAVGLVMAGLVWRAIRYGESLPDEQYGFAAGVVASALALPLFQAEFHRRRLATPYAEIYGHVWTDAICAAGALAFTGISWIVLALMSELFHLLKIDFLRDLMDEGAFGWTFSGLAAGAALGTLRNQLKVLATMQTVVLLVASLLAVPLAVGLVVFLLASAVSGPQVLWDATRNATPLLLACAAGAFVLANAIARQDDEAMTGNRIMRIAGLVLAAAILPLAVFAAFSMGLRLNQYGFAPERLWGLVAIVVACIAGVAYWAALVRGRKAGWAGYLRKATFHLGLVVCGLAIVLALPILDFAAISARNQVARLESGKVSPDRFDFIALRWDFGEPGKQALERLAEGDGRIAALAASALKATSRPSIYDAPVPPETLAVRVQPDTPENQQLVRDYLSVHPTFCRDWCIAVELYDWGEVKQFALLQGGRNDFMAINVPEVEAEESMRLAAQAGEEVEPTRAERTSRIELRRFEGRRVYVDGKPFGQPFE